jgi:hypothetical protein
VQRLSKETEQDAEPKFARARRTAPRGWVVQLTEDSLDPDNPAHLQALLRADERIPEIDGGASPPLR